MRLVYVTWFLLMASVIGACDKKPEPATGSGPGSSSASGSGFGAVHVSDAESSAASDAIAATPVDGASATLPSDADATAAARVWLTTLGKDKPAAIAAITGFPFRAQGRDVVAPCEKTFADAAALTNLWDCLGQHADSIATLRGGKFELEAAEAKSLENPPPFVEQSKADHRFVTFTVTHRKNPAYVSGVVAVRAGATGAIVDATSMVYVYEEGD